MQKRNVLDFKIMKELGERPRARKIAKKDWSSKTRNDIGRGGGGVTRGNLRNPKKRRNFPSKALLDEGKVNNQANGSQKESTTTIPEA